LTPDQPDGHSNVLTTSEGSRAVGQKSGVNIRFYIDEATELPHIDGHGVTEQEVHDVLARPGKTVRDAKTVESHSVARAAGDTFASSTFPIPSREAFLSSPPMIYRGKR
jgi:hypothetical protein